MLVQVFITVFLITVVISVAITFIMPESYASTCRIQVENESVASKSNTAFDPYLVQTELEVIRSQVVLEPAIARLNLNVEWGKKYFNGEVLKSTETLQIIKGRLSLVPVGNTKLIAITVYDEDRQEAAQIANAVAESYQEYSAEKSKAAQLSGQPKSADSVSVQIIDRALPANAPSKPNKPLNIALGMVAGIVLGGAAAALVGLFKFRR